MSESFLQAVGPRAVDSGLKEAPMRYSFLRRLACSELCRACERHGWQAQPPDDTPQLAAKMLPPLSRVWSELVSMFARCLTTNEIESRLEVLVANNFEMDFSAFASGQHHAFFALHTWQ